MTQTPPKPLETWEFFQFVKRALGETYLNKLFKISSTQILRWSRNPRLAYGDKAASNPLDHYEQMIFDLMDAGHIDVARAIVARQARLCGCELIPLESLVASDQGKRGNAGDWEAELLDNYEALSNYVTTARAYVAGKAREADVQDARSAAIREIAEDLPHLVAEAERLKKLKKVA